MTGHFVLPNGFKTIFSLNNNSPVLCLQLYIRIGSAHETPYESGYSHFIEHLAFKSTRDFSESQIAKYISSLGGSINAYTDFDCTCYYVILPTAYLSQGIYVLSELAINNTFSADDVNTEKQIIIEERHLDQSDPETEFLEYVQKKSLFTSPLSKPVLGTSKTIRSITMDKIMRFRSRYYNPMNSFLIVTGGTTNDTVFQAVNQHFSNWNKAHKYEVVRSNQQAGFAKPIQTNFTRKKKQTYIAYVLPELSETHPDSDSLYIALRYLAYGDTSRLHNRLIVNEQLCSSIKVTSISGINNGVTIICLNPLNTKLIERIQSIFFEEMQNIIEGNINKDEFEAIKKDLIYSWRYDLDNTEELANMLGYEELLDKYENLTEYEEKLRSLYYNMFRTIIRKCWASSHILEFIQTPDLKNCSSSFVNVFHQTQALEPTRLPELVLNSRNTPVPYRCIGKDYYDAVLSNGLRILYKRVAGKSTCAFALSTKLGRLSEPDELTGVNYLASSATLYSTIRYPYRELQSICRNHGINISLEHHIDSTIWGGKCMQSDLGTALDILYEIVFSPAFIPKYIKSLRLSAIDSIRRERNNPSFDAYQRWFRLLTGKIRKFENVTGGILDIRKISISEIKRWHSDYYHPANFSLAIVGSEDPDSLFSMLFYAFPSFALIESKTCIDSLIVPPLKAKRKCYNLGLEQTIIHIGGYAASAQDREHTTAFYILAHIVGGDLDSRMFCILREKWGLTYQTGFDYTATNDFGYWNAYAYCDSKDSDKCLNLMLEILDDIRINGVSDAELTETQNYMCGMYLFENENLVTLSASLANLDSLGYEPTYYQERVNRINSVDKNVILSIARKWFTPENYFIQVYS